ncbi:hypothetical protein BX616_009715 [Lobosporangium transversale]|uniref:BAG domain-containing protein n=1 Tax=Lobosporangium transversale TaxID=64571 RepID=A0A1Y2H019_9FUNG|nr:hypothetical protein BCR41DRAFT_347322 [Lobosporangium transversale]KAF9913707.1 hypothetical protein BX616_009715 [Lobosporangium transversale]ORZ27053.1 hypothetical protein BCR41DRAFT_347322 [Lobosporangium transversale]|eukprot:XP_021884800.1 hypothetical protein BCR41DRAFT_347322 [Lobosporangium transversale]
MVSDSTKKTLILSVSAIIGLTTISTLAYLLIQDDRRAKHLRKVKLLQKTLAHKLHKIETSVQELVDEDIRLAQVRTRTLRTHPIFPGDPHVKLPALGLINPQDKIDFGQEIEETQEELIRERTQGYSEDTAKVRQGYKRLDYLIASINERFLKLLESLDAISPRELTDLGDGFGGLPTSDGPEIQGCEKIRKRKRAVIENIQHWMTQMDKIAATFKDRLVAVEDFEKKAAEEAAEEEKETKKKNEDKGVNGHNHVVEHTAESNVVKEGLSFAEVASHNIPEPEILKPTEDLEKMKEGVTFADVVSHDVTQYEHSDASSTITTTTTTTTTTKATSININSSSSISNDGSEKTHEHGHLEKVTEDISFADVVAHHIPEEHKEKEVEEKKEEEILEPTEDLEMMKSGVTFADIVSHHVEKEEENIAENEVLEQTEDLEKMKSGLTFADVVAENLEETEKENASATAQ